MWNHKKIWLGIVLSITVFIVFFQLGSLPLFDPDEPVYAQTAKEMIAYHDYVSPRIYGEFWYDKPPMYYWLVAACFKIFGISEWAARFPSAMAAVLCVGVVYRFGRKVFGQAGGIASALVLATSVEFFYVAKAAVTDMTLTFLLTAALLFFWEKKYYLFYLFAALATVTKGPIGLVFPGVIVASYVLYTKSWQVIKEMKLPSGALLYSGVALPWYVVMYQLHGQAFLDTFIGYHNITRFTTAEHAATSGWYFFIPVVIIGFFPWITLLGQAVRASFSEGRTSRPVLVFLQIWAAFIFTFFSLSSTKLVTYILPMYPPLALIVGWYIGRWYEERENCQSGYVWPLSLSILIVSMLGGMYVAGSRMPELVGGFSLLALILLMLLLLVWHSVYAKNPLAGIGAQVIAMVVTASIIVAVLAPAVSARFTSRTLAQEFAYVYDQTSPVYVTKFLHPGFSFYSHVFGTEIKSVDELRQALARQASAYYVLRQADYQGLTDQERAQMKVLWTSNKLLLVKQAQEVGGR